VTLTFFAAGKPEPQGSSKGFVGRDRFTGKPRAVVTSDNAKLRPWRVSVQNGAQLALERAGLVGRLAESDVTISAHFFLPAPKWAEAKLRKGKSVPCITRPDVDKLLRGLLDSLTGLVFADDAQIVKTLASKGYAPPGSQPGVYVTIETSGSAEGASLGHSGPSLLDAALGDSPEPEATRG
jgi:crossover junction endodeoxyribonuclease RusA